MNRRAVGLLACAHLVADANQGALPALLPLLIVSHHWSYAMAASLVFSANAASSFLQPLMGQLADRFQAQWLVWAGMLLATLGMSLVGVAPTYGLMLVAVALSGIGSAAFHPEAARLMNIAAGERRAVGMSFLSVGGNAGFALGPLMATAVTLAFGLHGTVLLLVPASVLAVILFARLGKSLESHAGAGLRVQETEPLEDTWGPFALLTATIVFRSVITYGMNTFLPLYWVAVLHQSKEAGARALTLLLISGAAGTLLGGRVADRMGRQRVILTALALLPFLLFLFIRIASPSLALAVLVPLGMVLFAPFSVMVVLGQEYMPNRVAMASGVTMGLAGSIGGLAAPVLGSIADHRGMQTSFQVLVGLAVLTFLLATTLRERIVRQARTSTADPLVGIPGV